MDLHGCVRCWGDGSGTCKGGALLEVCLSGADPTPRIAPAYAGISLGWVGTLSDAVEINRFDQAA